MSPSPHFSLRFLFSLVLALLLSLNAAFAAAVGVCDAFEETSGHGPHAYHHQHEHPSTDAHPEHETPPDQTSVNGALPDGNHDHDHCHAHASFLTLTGDESGIGLFPSRSPLVARPVNALVSTWPIGLDRPPKSRSA